MSNNKQSSVEWYIIERHSIEIQSRLGLISPIEYDAKLIKIEEQAIEMHMEEICDAHYYGQESDRMADTWNDHPEHWACEYYLKKFNNQQ